MDSFSEHRMETVAGTLSAWMREGEGMQLVCWPSIIYDQTLYAGLAATVPNPMLVICGPGMGTSGLNNRNLATPRLAEAAAEVATKLLGTRDFAMIGTSWGSLVAAELAANRYPALKAAALFNVPWTKVPSAKLSDRMIAFMASTIPTTRMFRTGVAKNFFARETLKRNEVLVDAFLAQNTFANPGFGSAVAHVLVHRHKLPEPDLSAISIPISVISGEQDSLYPLEEAQRRTRTIPGATHMIIEGTAHISAAENPHAAAKAVTQLIERI